MFSAVTHFLQLFWRLSSFSRCCAAPCCIRFPQGSASLLFMTLSFLFEYRLARSRGAGQGSGPPGQVGSVTSLREHWSQLLIRANTFTSRWRDHRWLESVFLQQFALPLGVFLGFSSFLGSFRTHDGAGWGSVFTVAAVCSFSNVPFRVYLFFCQRDSKGITRYVR